VNARNILHLPALTVLECDVHDEAALTQAMQGMDAVVNLVAILHGSPAAFEWVHCALPEKIARACQKKLKLPVFRELKRQPVYYCCTVHLAALCPARGEFKYTVRQ
jgi:uncharacterized protein YbjT (DUF2867 family)